MKRQFLDRPFEVKTLSDEGFFVGYASVFEELDSYRDVVKPGAFTKSLAQFKSNGRKVPILWQHNGSQPIGVYVEIEEDTHGLKVTGELNLETQLGREAYALLKQGALSGISIGYSTVRDETDSKSGVRRLYELKLFEASLVTFPANESARVTDVKSIDQLENLSDCESYLRDAGMSKSEAVAIVSRIKAIAKRSESADAEAKAVRNALAIFSDSQQKENSND